MKTRNQETALKIFGISNQMLELELERIERNHSVDLGRAKTKVESDNIYYPQFELEVRQEAKRMARNYEVFYCLERSIRTMIQSMIQSQKGTNWWDEENVVPSLVKNEVKIRIQKEIDSGVTRRSDDPIDFTTFGELGEIIKCNWTIFNAIFKSQKAVEGVMNKLNTIRAPIAHCTALAEDEELRLQLSVRDWFRLME